MIRLTIEAIVRLILLFYLSYYERSLLLSGAAAVGNGRNSKGWALICINAREKLILL